MSTLPGKHRANWIPAPQFYNLNQQCRVLVEAFGWCVYQVGSSLERRDFRDVDVRVIMDDADYDRIFQCDPKMDHVCALWSLMCVSISEWLRARTGLPIDFQIQRMSEANIEYPHQPRNALGIFLKPDKQKE